MSKEQNQLDRRSFLKSSGLAVAATVTVGSERHAAAEVFAKPATAIHEVAADPVSHVNILQGTNSEYLFSRGNTLPIAAMPFGMAHWTLQSRAGNAWMFQPNERRFQGFRSTHQLSPWLGDYGHATFMPVCGATNPEAASRSTSIRPEEAKLSPNSMQLELLRYGIDAELIPTERGAVITANFRKDGERALIFDIPGDKAVPEMQQDAATRTLRFTSSDNRGGVPAGFATYYVLQFAQPWKSFELRKLKDHHVGIVALGPDTKSMEVRIATSFISFEQAERNLQLELGTKPPATLREEGRAVWNKLLKRIEIGGATPTQARTFYSCLYRTLLFPRMWHEPAADGTMHHRSAFNGKIVPGVMYADHGYWDVYRAWYPMMTILFPERLADILQAWVNAYKEGGWLPQFPCPGYRACMTGSLIDSVFGDAAAKGLKGFDLATAYEGLKKHATQPGNPDAGWGRRGVTEYMKYGYAPYGVVEQSAAETVDQAYGDFCIAQVAKAVGKQDDAAMFMKRSESWKHIFDTKTGFIRGKKVDGSFIEPFDPTTWGDPYVEGAAWQHRFDAPHDVEALFVMLGGKEKAVAALEEMITMAPDFNVGSYKQEIHEMSEMAAVHFGQYAHSNQPVHHILYLFTAAGRPDRTRYWTRRVMNELYTPDTFAGDEDTGSMAAWYVLSALGFYPLCPGKAEYTLGGALFPRATVHLPNGKELVVERAAKGREDAPVRLGIKTLTATISHDEVLAGGRLTFPA
ncbi:MAG: GH92 family glycosyl hydrolase [Janthinobacterium lividum]